LVASDRKGNPLDDLTLERIQRHTGKVLPAGRLAAADGMVREELREGPHVPAQPGLRTIRVAPVLPKVDGV
jgi:hypothetical protein